MDPKMNILVIYTLEDNDAMLFLLRHLRLLDGEFVTVWHDNPIYLGQQWKPKNESRLNQTDIFLFLVSNTFMHSEFIKQLEFKKVIDSYKAGESIVIPILLDECPWDIDFKSDDYNFNLNELHVLPEGRRPISDWESPDQVYNQIAAHIKKEIDSFTEHPDREESNIRPEEKATNTEIEDQIAINFSEEEAKAKRRVEEEKKIRKEAEALANRKAAEEKRLREEVETKRKAVEENRIKETAVANHRAEQERRQKEEAEAKIRTEENRLREEKKAKRKVEVAQQAKIAAKNNQKTQEAPQRENTDKKKRILVGLLVTVGIIAGIWIVSRFNNNGSEKESLPGITTTDTITEKDSVTLEKPIIEPPKKEVSVAKLVIGDTYEGGIVFAVDPSGKTGKIVHPKDAGPMPWKNAMKIHEKLGEGWRLPTFYELQIMYRNIGQGATNSGEFADVLYWSATSYDEYQARLLRFSDGNTSYHYNKAVENRKFLVRAVRDFSQ